MDCVYWQILVFPACRDVIVSEQGLVCLSLGNAYRLLLVSIDRGSSAKAEKISRILDIYLI